MKLASELVWSSLGPLLRAVMQDSSVVAAHLHGAGTALVEKDDGTTVRGPAIDAAAIEATAQLVRRGMQLSTPALTAHLDGGEELTVVDAPQLPGGAIITIESGLTPTTELESIAAPPLARTLHGMLRAGLSMLVVGSDRRARRVVMQALLSAAPTMARIVVVDDGSPLKLRSTNVIHLPLSDTRAVAVAALMRSLPSLRADWVCLPDVMVGGASSLQAACAANATIAGCAASDGEAALALLAVSHPTAATLAAGAFRAVLEVSSSSGRVRIRALREHNRLPDGRTSLTTLFSENALTWLATPGFAHRVRVDGDLPWADGAPSDAGEISIVTTPTLIQTDPDALRPVLERKPPVGVAPDDFESDVTSPVRAPRASDERAALHASMGTEREAQEWEEDTSTGVGTPQHASPKFAISTNPGLDLPPALQGNPTALVQVPALGIPRPPLDEEEPEAAPLPPPPPPRPTFREGGSFRSAAPAPPFKESPSFRAAQLSKPPLPARPAEPRRPAPPPPPRTRSAPNPLRGPVPADASDPGISVDDLVLEEEAADTNESGVFAKSPGVDPTPDDEG